jgi:hypothetical protein
MAVGDNDLNDPEDAYDATDPPKVRLLNFIRRLRWLDDHVELDLTTFSARLQRLVDDLETLRGELVE